MSTPGSIVTELSSRTIIAPGIADLSFRMIAPARLDFQAGQFVSIAVEGNESLSSARRSYSIASQTDAGDQLRFIIRVIPSGAASELLMFLPIGASMRMTGPHGFFVLDAHHPGDVVFGATGTGVAAVMPMLGELSRRSDGGRRYLFWGLRHQSDLFAHDEIARLCERSTTELRVYLSAPDQSWTGARGRITPAVLDTLPHLVSPTFYLVGNGAMITELKRELVARGINRKKQIRTEAFFD
ncbi:MAG TPA: FAD-binding oxidoreductase [Polyangia bacterium]|jgi:ferredoxin-NADP reductase|nr:FAD-binding oxidoreductase [Polyangia bacterium]